MIEKGIDKDFNRIINPIVEFETEIRNNLSEINHRFISNRKIWSVNEWFHTGFNYFSFNISVPDDTTDEPFKSKITNKAIDCLIKILRFEKFFQFFS